jgi:hypothetical protein
MQRRILPLLSLLIAAGFMANPLPAASPDQEKAFTEKYKTAFEGNDSATLESFLYTKGADPMVLDFYKSMIAQGAGGKISKIELVELSAEGGNDHGRSGRNEIASPAQTHQEIENHGGNQRRQRHFFQ